MFQVQFLLIFIFFFYLVHICGRLLCYIHLWQTKKYDCKRVFSHIKKFKPADITPILVSSLLAFSGILLYKLVDVNWLYLVILVGFGYFVFSAFRVLTQIFLGKLTQPEMHCESVITAGVVLVLCFIPLFAAFQFSNELILKDFFTFDGICNAIPVQIRDLLPQKVDGSIVIPFETAVLVLFFRNLFIVDLILPLVAAVVSIISFDFCSVFSRNNKKT